MVGIGYPCPIMPDPSYNPEDVDRWLALTPEERVLEGESLWNEFLVKYPKIPWEPFWKGFDSFDDLTQWLNEQGNPALW